MVDIGYAITREMLNIVGRMKGVLAGHNDAACMQWKAKGIACLATQNCKQ